MAKYLGCSVLDIVDRLKSGAMTGDEYEKYLVCAQAHTAVEEQRERDRQRQRQHGR